ncbi:MAG: family 43 glycosylhydrolase [Candidatus Eisenbacteria bacterium]|nr:family 43 glycosylhydrolase [Candidatus Eisenbacteria bacterium]
MLRHRSRPPRRSARGAAGLLAALAIALTGLAPHPAAGAWMVPPYPYRAKDFAVVKSADGWFHCFYIRNDFTAPYDSTERDLGHAISRDLYNWIQQPTVIPARVDNWDNLKIWAPTIVLVDGVYYMLYTGVTYQPGVYDHYQRIGLATSTDLYNWNRLDAPVFSCEDVPWTVCDPTEASTGEFRDPFVMPAPQGGGWLMYYDTHPASAPSTYIAGVAASNDLTHWTDLKPLWATQTAWSGSALVESPHVFAHAGLWYLLFTGDGSQPLRWMTGSDPTGDPAAWTQRGTLASMLGTDTHLWFASEKLTDGLVDYLCFADYDRADFRKIIWHDDGTFAVTNPDLLHVYDMSWSSPSAATGQSVSLVIRSANAFGQRVHFAVYAEHADGSEEQVPNAAVQFPDSLALMSATTTFTWTAYSWPDPYQSTANLVVRITDWTACTTPIAVAPQPFVDIGSVSNRDGERYVPRELVEFSRRPAGAGFRALARSPVSGIAMLVDLRAPASLRIDLYDLAGRRIRSLADREFPAGASVVAWDGRDATGAAMRPGVYFARLRSAASDRTIRLLLER